MKYTTTFCFRWNTDKGLKMDILTSLNSYDCRVFLNFISDGILCAFLDDLLTSATHVKEVARTSDGKQ